MTVAFLASAPTGTTTRPPAAAVPQREHPWELADLRRLVRVLGLSGTGLVVAWLVASGTTDPARQEYAAAGGVVATALTVAGLAGWVLVGVRAVRVRRHALGQEVRALVVRRTPVAAPVAVGTLVTVRGTAHRHQPQCLMVRGKTVRAVRGTALAPCPVCLPGEAP